MRACMITEFWMAVQDHLSLDTELTKESQKPLIVNTSLFTPRSRSYQSQFNKRWQELGDLPGGCLLFCIERMSLFRSKRVIVIANYIPRHLRFIPPALNEPLPQVSLVQNVCSKPS